MTAPSDRPTSNPPEPGPRLPGLTPAGRELLEVLWGAGRPVSTRQLQDALARRFPHRAGRKIQTVSTLLAELMAQGWVAGEKRAGTRWVYRPAVSRDQGLTQIARWVVEEFVREPEDRLCLIREGLRMVGYVPSAPAGPRRRDPEAPARRRRVQVGGEVTAVPTATRVP